MKQFYSAQCSGIPSTFAIVGAANCSPPLNGSTVRCMTSYNYKYKQAKNINTNSPNILITNLNNITSSPLSYITHSYAIKHQNKRQECSAAHKISTVRFSSSLSSSAAVPTWVSSLRADAKAAEKTISYDIRIYNEMAWRRHKFEFTKESWDPNTMSAIMRQKLTLGSEEKEYTIIGEALPFPDKEDSPVINEPSTPCRLIWDHNSPTEKIMIQLSVHFPPLLWITVKPTLSAL
eukprot:Tbor_TRINITY_DN8888_c0_g1::TRINITY_DN8888_c0_g1_i1::g.17743::m.17743